MTWRWPDGSLVRPQISYQYGPRDPSVGESAFHYGTDFIGFSTVCAIADGTVTQVTGNVGNAGRQIWISHGNGVNSVYQHLASQSVKRGQKVTAGQPIGVMGATGNATGKNLHLGIYLNGKPINPVPYIAARMNAPASAGSSTIDTEDEDMPIVIIETDNPAAAKARLSPNGKGRRISKAENNVYRGLQKFGTAVVVYQEVSDADFKSLVA